MNGRAGHGIHDGNRIDVVNLFGAGGIGDQAQAQAGRGHAFVNLRVLRITAAFIIGEEVGLAAPKRGSQRSASGSAEAVVVIGDQRGASAGDIAQAIFLLRMVVEPGVRAEVAAQIILISCSMPGIAAAASHELHLSSGRAIEVGGLVGDVDLELLDALHRRGHHSGGSAPSRS